MQLLFFITIINYIYQFCVKFILNEMKCNVMLQISPATQTEFISLR